MSSVNLRPMHSDVLLRRVRKYVKESDIFLGAEDVDQTGVVFEIVAIGQKVKHVSVGEHVLVPWTRVTDPFTYEEERFGITDEKEILAVIDY